MKSKIYIKSSKNKTKKIKNGNNYKTKTKIKHLIKRDNTKKIYKKYGGKITSNDILEKIISIGFEFETGNMIPIQLKNFREQPPVEKYIADSETNVVSQPRDFTSLYPDTKVYILSTIDTPLLSGGVNSLMSIFENKYKPQIEDSEIDNETVKFRKFIDKYIHVYSTINSNLGYIFFNHTEYMFTFLPLDSHKSINDKNIILIYFEFIVYYLKSLKHQKTIEDISTNSKIKIFSNDTLLYLIPMEINDDYTPATIKWVPQMTINIKVVDVISVLEYLSIGLNKESINTIRDCKKFVDKIINTSRLSESSELQILNILKCVLFMLLYIVVYAGTIEGMLDTDFDKNMFDFLFRSSLATIVISLYGKYTSEEINSCLDILKGKLVKEKGIIDKKKMRRERITEFENDTYNASISFINFINVINNDEIKSIISTIDDFQKYNFDEIHEKILEYNIINDNYSNVYSSTNTFFTEIFNGVANYYPYDTKNESILIEYRSFSQMLLYEADDTINNVYRSLDDWTSIIERIKINETNTQPQSKKQRK